MVSSYGIDLRFLLAPDSIAVVGASERPGPGRQVVENLLTLGYTGRIYPINPRYEFVLGLPCYSSLSELAREGHRVEAVAILLSRDKVPQVLEEAAEIGVRAAWAFASGFAEAGPDGKALQSLVVKICNEAGIALCGPNCVGFINPLGKVALYSAPLPLALPAGRVGAVAQSGSVCLALANSNRGLGFSLLVSSGNEAVLDSTDYIAYMVEDPNTDVILAFIEQFRRPERFIEVAQRARAKEKPIVVLKVGRSQLAQRAAIAHTGALVGSDAVCDAVFKKYGIVRVDDLDEMMETAAVLVKLKGNFPKGNRVGMITVSGGEIGLIGDLAEGLNLKFPEWSLQTKEVFQSVLPPYSTISNPLDAWGSGKIDETYPPCMAAAARDKEIDILLISQDAPEGMAPAQVEQYTVVAKAAVQVAKETGKPVVAISNLSGGLHPELFRIFDQGGVPLLRGTREGLRAVHHLICYAQALKRPLSAPVSKRRAKGVLCERDASSLLAKYGIPCPKEVLCQSEEKAIAAASQIGYPVVLKVISRELLHKTEAGAVRLGIKNEKELRSAFHEVLANVTRCVPKEEIEGVLVQEMITNAVAEVIVGFLRDPDFGPVVVFGSGGILVEVLQDRSLGLPPITREEALEMVHSTKVWKLLTGFRGRPKGDLDALVDVIMKVSNLALDFGNTINAFEINPLLVLPQGQGVRAVDVRLEVKPTDNGGERGN